jgi:hypothetical protein
MDHYTKSKLRSISSADSTALFNLVMNGKAASVMNGIQPTEVWLGPTAARILSVESNHQLAEGRVPSPASMAALIADDMEGAQLMGLCVRLMAKEGVRVGTTF